MHPTILSKRNQRKIRYEPFKESISAGSNLVAFNAQRAAFFLRMDILDDVVDLELHAWINRIRSPDAATLHALDLFFQSVHLFQKALQLTFKLEATLAKFCNHLLPFRRQLADVDFAERRERLLDLVELLLRVAIFLASRFVLALHHRIDADLKLRRNVRRIADLRRLNLLAGKRRAAHDLSALAKYRDLLPRTYLRVQNDVGDRNISARLDFSIFRKKSHQSFPRLDEAAVHALDAALDEDVVPLHLGARDDAANLDVARSLDDESHCRGRKPLL